MRGGLGAGPGVGEDGAKTGAGFDAGVPVLGIAVVFPIDVAEEIARLITHMDELERVLKKGGAVGKRLDFLMQELNREANTLSSKSVSGEVTAIALELKLLIEQMREQVQNLE